MIKIDHKTAQAATELAVFGAILIFLLGTIVRSAVGNGLTQNQNFNTMRTAMLSSWIDSRASNPSHNSASLLIVEDRLSPDFNKYGDLDRNAFTSSSGGSFTYEMLYPVGISEVNDYLPIMDVWINGQHFPFTTAAFASQTIAPASTSCESGGPYTTYPLTPAQCQQNQCLRNQREWVQIGANNYKLFFTMVPNLVSNGADNFAVVPPTCALNSLNTVACKDLALSSSLTLPDSQGGTYNNGTVGQMGDMEFDLLRNGDYSTVDAQFPLTSANCPVPEGVPTTNLIRCNIAWQWAADVAAVEGNATDGADPMIGLDPDNNEYPSYDIDGRLKEVTIYALSADPTSHAITSVSYEDFQGGDIDTTWDSNSCTPKPGLQSDSQMYTFTLNGTYLQIKDGQLYNPQTGQVVSSVNQRNNIDVIQRTIQLSNNTGRFCNGNTPQPCVAECTSPSGSCAPSQMICAPTSDPNPVEACSNNCFTSNTIAETCYDTSTNMIYVRSRLEDRRGTSWLTNASGQLQVQ